MTYALAAVCRLIYSKSATEQPSRPVQLLLDGNVPGLFLRVHHVPCYPFKALCSFLHLMAVLTLTDRCLQLLGPTAASSLQEQHSGGPQTTQMYVVTIQNATGRSPCTLVLCDSPTAKVPKVVTFVTPHSSPSSSLHTVSAQPGEP